MHLPSVLLLSARISGNGLHSANIISNIGSCSDNLREKLKLKGNKALYSKFSWYMDFMAFSWALFQVKKLASWNTRNLTYYLSYNIAKKNCHFLRFKKSVPPFDQFYYFRKLALITSVSKIVCYFSLFICHIRETEG